MNKYYVVDTTEQCSNRFLNERRCGGLEYGSYYDYKSQFTLIELERLESQYDVNLLHNKDLALLPVDLLDEYKMGRNVTIPLPFKSKTLISNSKIVDIDINEITGDMRTFVNEQPEKK